MSYEAIVDIKISQKQFQIFVSPNNLTKTRWNLTKLSICIEIDVINVGIVIRKNCILITEL